MTGHLDDFEQYLLRAPRLVAFEPKVVSGGGHQGKFAMILEGGTLVYVKPASGVADGGRATACEAAAWDVARLLGWTDLVATTVLRPLYNPHVSAYEIAACMPIWPGDFCPPLDVFSDEEVWQAAVFDYLIQHTDRPEGNNYFGVPPGATPPLGGVPKQQLKLIDHGYAFDYPGRSFVSVFHQRRAGQEPPVWILDAVARLLADHERSPLSQRIPVVEYEAVVTRARTLLGRRELP